MAKHIENVPSLKDFRAPWESETGEAEIDKDKLKKFIHNLITDKAKAQDARDEEVEKAKAIETERDELKETLDSKDPDASKKIAKAERERDAAKEAAKAADLRADRLEVAMDKGLTPAQAKRLQGETKEELEADADEILELFGKPSEKDPEDDDEDEDDVDAAGGRTAPKTTAKRLTNGGDGNNSADAEPDYDKIAAEISGSRLI